MLTCDFLFLVENYKRGELENACLIGAELKKRGYSVVIRYFRDTGKYCMKPKVVIIPNCYADSEIDNYTYFLRKKSIKVVDLQYEQVLSKNSEKSDFYTLTGLAREIIHINWGVRTKERLLGYGLREKLLPVTGFITLDFYDSKFDSLFLSKGDLEKKYNIPNGKRWNLFASNFTLIDKETYRFASRTFGNDISWRRNQMIECQKTILDWFEKAMAIYPDQVIIYRPHPSEIVDKRVLIMQKKYTNFFCISDYSLKQWVRYANTLMVYFSTSITDALYKGINSYILRPLNIPEDEDVQFMVGEDFIRDERTFLSVMGNVQYRAPVNEGMMREYYGSFNDFMSYVRVADVCEVALKSRYKIIYPQSMRKSFLRPRGMASRLIQKIQCYVPFYKFWKKGTEKRLFAEMDYIQCKYLIENKDSILKNIEQIIADDERKRKKKYES